MKKVCFLSILCIFFLKESVQAKTTLNALLETNIKLKNSDSIIAVLDSYYRGKKYNVLIENAQKRENELLKKPKIDSLLISKIRHKKGYANYTLGNYQLAIADFNNAISSLPKSGKDSNLHATILFDRSYAEYYFNRRTDYYKSLKESAVILGKLDNPDYDYLLEVYAELSYETKYLGYFEEAENYLQKGYDIIKAKKNKTSKDVLFKHYSISLYCSWKKEEEALNHLNDLEALKQRKTFNPAETLMYAVSLNLMADFYLVNIDKFDKNIALTKAESYLDKAFKNLNKENNKDSYLQFKFNYNKLLLEKEAFEDVLKGANELLTISKETDTRRSFFIAMKAKAFFKMKAKEKAEEALFQMVSSIHNDSTYLKQDYSNFKPSFVLHHTGLLVELADEFLEAFSNDDTVVEQANKIYLIALKQFKNCYWQSKFNKNTKEIYNKSISGILNTQKLNEDKNFNISIINDIENIENRLAWKAFINNRTTANIAIPDSVRYKELELRQIMLLAKQKNDNQKYINTKETLEAFNKQLKKDYPKIASFVYQDFSIENLQKQLVKGQIILRYKKHKKHFFVFVITANNIEIIPIKKNVLTEEKIEAYINNLSSIKEHRILGKELTKALIPINVSNYNSIIVIPDGILHHLPFETLTTKSGNFLVEDYSVSYAPHLVFINKTEMSESKAKNNLYIFSATYNLNGETNLQGALSESKSIHNIFNGELFIGDDALKSNFINNAFKADVLHLAMHAKLNDANPELSYFSFTEKEENNKMYLEELYGLNLKAELAVLSACNTGKSDLKNPEGAISLQRAFTFSGVPCTVSSLWQVPDVETSKIMVHFYKYLKLGKTKDTALRLAKIDYLKETKDAELRHPFYWAGFVISGDMSPIASSATNYWFALVLGLLVVIIMLYKRKQLIQFFK
nr:CHAT domain-containing protein [Gaetbulibacter sp. 4G1]